MITKEENGRIACGTKDSNMKNHPIGVVWWLVPCNCKNTKERIHSWTKKYFASASVLCRHRVTRLAPCYNCMNTKKRMHYWIKWMIHPLLWSFLASCDGWYLAAMAWKRKKVYILEQEGIVCSRSFCLNSRKRYISALFCMQLSSRQVTHCWWFLHRIFDSIQRVYVYIENFSIL